MNEPSVRYARRLGLFSGTMAVIGGIIGSGIFLNPAIVAQRVGSTTLTVTAWALGGVVALAGAFIFGELAARNPRVGGGYAYLRDAIGPLPAFLYGWALLLVISTGAIAAVGFTFASYAGALIGLPQSSLPWLAGGAILLLTIVNYVGVQTAAWTQNVFTLLKLAALAILITAGLLLAPGETTVVGGAVGGAGPAGADGTSVLAAPLGFMPVALALATAFVPVLFAYGGWQQTNFIAEELIDAERNLPRALVLGVLGVVVVYLLANFAYLRVLGVEGLARSTAPAADTMAAVLGSPGRTLISLGIVASTFGFLNLVILVSPRVYQAMAADGLFFGSFARLHPRYRTPTVAIIAQGIWACLLLATRSYGQLLDYVTFTDWIFFASVAGTLLIYRRRQRDQPTPGSFRVPAFPLTVGLFILAAGYVVVGSVRSNPGNALRGALLLAAGIPAYLLWASRRKSAAIR
jgi:APA family basic amino acid/polyamine antiporter